jgi:hypothetical protein
MKFLSIYGNAPGESPGSMNKEQMDAMGKLIEETTKSGALILTGGIQPISKGGARIRSSAGEIRVDGPFTETKEVVGGFAVLEADSREEAIELVRKFLKIAGDGECELHQLMEEPGERR